MTEHPTKPRQTAGVIAPPPFIYAGALIIGILLRRALPFPVYGIPFLGLIGLVLMVIGGLLGSAAVQAFHKAKTEVRPDKPSTSLVTTGVYRFTRNPIYLGFTLAYIGVALITGAVIALALLPIVLIIINRGVIDREERYLTRIFGDSYLQYMSRVRRWL